jgi:hypothetical protein
MRSTLYFPITCAFAFATSTVAQSCSAPPFYTNPAYGVKSGCIPTNYNSAADLGNTSPTDAATRCAQQCSKSSTCGGWAAQLNKAPDSGLYSGSCFLYTSLPATPRSCADKPSQLVAGVRDDTAKCFASNSAAATAFCSSYLSIGQKTVTVTAATPTVTATSVLTTVAFSTSTAIASVTDTTTKTVETDTAYDTTIIVETATTTTTVTPAATITVYKRAAAQPTCVPSGIPASQLADDCKCLSITSKTVTTTITPTAVTTRTTTTAISTSPVATTQTTLLTVTVPVTATVKETTSTITTTVQTATATACVVPAGNILTNPGFNDGSYTGWNPGGNGGFSNTITDDAQCGGFGARFAVSSTYSYGRIGQTFRTLDQTKNYQIRTYVKLVSGTATNCYYYVTCQKPDSMSSADNVIIRTDVSSLSSTWTPLLVTCPPGAKTLGMSISLQCNQSPGPVVIDVDETAMYPISQPA